MIPLSLSIWVLAVRAPPGMGAICDATGAGPNVVEITFDSVGGKTGDMHAMSVAVEGGAACPGCAGGEASVTTVTDGFAALQGIFRLAFNDELTGNLDHDATALDVEAEPVEILQRTLL